MKMKLFLFSLLSITAIINFYCSSSEGFPDKGVPIGYFTTVTLEADRRNGYEWIIVGNSDPGVLGYVSKEFTETSVGKGNEIFKFKGLKLGRVDIIFNYVNKSLSSNKVYKSKKIDIMVR